jgi:hypothetical protein
MRTNRWMVAVVVGLGLMTAWPSQGESSNPQPAGAEPAHYGLTVVDGVLMRDGRPYRGIGINYFNPFLRHLQSSKDTSYEAGFETLASAKIPFARFCGCGFYPSEQKLYEKNPSEFFRRFDDIVHTAERNGIGLIPCLFWTHSTVPDLVGESMDQWGNPQSKTHEYMRRYVHDVVTRYRGSPAIWGWECGNEWNLGANLPNASSQRPRVLPELGTPTSRSAKDEVSYKMIRTVFLAFAQEVRKYDEYRVISTGNSSPRECAWHNWKEKSWKADTPEQQAAMLRRDNPDPIDLLCVHIYDPAGRGVAADMALARSLKKPLFIGEFGAEESPTGRENFARLLGAIENAQVPLAALWVFDLSSQGKSWNVTAANERAYQLQAITEANARIRAALDAQTK